MRLDRYTSNGFQRGAPRAVEALWLATSGLFVASWLPGSAWRVALLRLFGAQIGRGAIVKPGVRVKFPWRLTVGDHCWIGERVWIDNLTEVTLGDHVCLSQASYLCTGSHDWSRERFDLIVQPISIESHAWVGARAIVAPGTTLEQGAVLAMGATGRGRLAPWHIHGASDTPRQRRLRSPHTMPDPSRA